MPRHHIRHPLRVTRRILYFIGDDIPDDAAEMNTHLCPVARHTAPAVSSNATVGECVPGASEKDERLSMQPHTSMLQRKTEHYKFETSGDDDDRAVWCSLAQFCKSRNTVAT